MKKISKILITLSVIIFIISLASFFYVKDQLFSPLSNDSGEKIFEIKEGQGVKEIVTELKKEGLIKNDFIALAYLKVKNLSGKLKSGYFLINKNQTSVEVLNTIVIGKSALKKITIIEGWTINDIADYLDQRGILNKDEFLKESNIKNWDYDFLIGVDSLEGYLYPDTYAISYKADAKEIINKMLDNFDKKLKEGYREEIKNQGKTIEDIIILASIVEKEVSKKEDKKIVAGIFLNRLSIDKALEADSTINYITGKNNPQPTLSDLSVNSRYNTYKNKGLPPGAICSPSISSIEAVIYPIKTDYFFYLNRQDTKETIFSKTYEEHLKNKQKYLN